MFDLIHCSDRIRFLCSFFFDSEIRQNIFKNRPHDRGTDRSSIIYALRIVYNTDSKDPGIFCRNKSKKRGNVFICTSRQCLGSRCLSSYMISFDIGLFAASFGNDFFRESSSLSWKPAPIRSVFLPYKKVFPAKYRYLPALPPQNAA